VYCPQIASFATYQFFFTFLWEKNVEKRISKKPEFNLAQVSSKSDCVCRIRLLAKNTHQSSFTTHIKLCSFTHPDIIPPPIHTHINLGSFSQILFPKFLSELNPKNLLFY